MILIRISECEIWFLKIREDLFLLDRFMCCDSEGRFSFF